MIKVVDFSFILFFNELKKSVFFCRFLENIKRPIFSKERGDLQVRSGEVADITMITALFMTSNVGPADRSDF